MKAYRTLNGITEYWEAWDDSVDLIFHWGKLGETGETSKLPLGDRSRAIEAFEREKKRLIEEGFKSVKVEQMAQVVIQYKIDGMGSTLDLDKEQVVEGLMNECLGWTGLGNCDGHDIGSGTLNVFCDVVNGPASEQIVIDCLKENGQIEGAVIARRERVGDESYIVFWPRDFVGEFDLI